MVFECGRSLIPESYKVEATIGIKGVLEFEFSGREILLLFDDNRSGARSFQMYRGTNSH